MKRFSKTPAVASNVGDIPLKISDGLNGFLHHPYDLRGSSNSIVKLPNDDKLRDSMGKAHAEKKFSNKAYDWLARLNDQRFVRINQE